MGRYISQQELDSIIEQRIKERNKSYIASLLAKWPTRQDKLYIASTFKVSESTVDNIHKIAKDNNGTYVPPTPDSKKHQSPKKRKIDNILTDIEAANGHFSINEVSEKLKAQGTTATRGYITKVARERGFSPKKGGTVGRPNDPVVCLKRMAILPRYVRLLRKVLLNDPKSPHADVQYWFVDESRFEQSPIRCSSVRWSRKGRGWTYGNFKTKRSHSLNCILFVRSDGLYYTYTSTCNLDAQLFNDIMMDMVMWNKNENAGEPDLHFRPMHFIFDNATVHREEDLLALSSRYKFKWSYTPKYSPDLNLCEFWFGAAKSRFRSEHSHLDTFKPNEWKAFLEQKLSPSTKLDPRKVLHYMCKLGEELIRQNGNVIITKQVLSEMKRTAARKKRANRNKRRRSSSRRQLRLID